MVGNCTDGPQLTELEFAQRWDPRGIEICLGPLINMVLPESHVRTLRGALAVAGTYKVYSLCAGHWMSLCSLLGLRARFEDRSDWFLTASWLVKELCQQVHWDQKEVANLMKWRHVLLTQG